jgi:DNA-binding beta-propeller fold protein YncE
VFVTVGKSGSEKTVLTTEDNAKRLRTEYQDYCTIDDSLLYQVLISDEGDKVFATTDSDYISFLNNMSELENIPFVFVKSTIDRLNYFAKVRNTGEFSTALNKKKMTGMYELPNLNTAIDYDVLNYKSFSTVDLSEQFVVRTPFKTDSNMDLFMIIQSLRTKKYYVVNNYLFNMFQDYDHMGDKEYGYGYVFKPVPEELTPVEKERYTRLMRIVNQGSAKSDQIEKVLKKYPLRNMYDISRISTADKKVYNKLLREMKALYKQAYDILNYEDENKKVLNRLTLKEVAKYDRLSYDCNGAFEINI